jgi:hypothetical protein
MGQSIDLQNIHDFQLNRLSNVPPDQETHGLSNLADPESSFED